MCEGAFVPSAYVGRGVKHTEAALNVKNNNKKTQKNPSFILHNQMSQSKREISAQKPVHPGARRAHVSLVRVLARGRLRSC